MFDLKLHHRTARPVRDWIKGENLSTFMEVRKLDPGLGIGGMENKRIGRYLPRVGSPIVYV